MRVSTASVPVACNLLLAAMFWTSACGGDDITPPKPAPPMRPYRESDDWVKPGRNVRLKGGVGPGTNEGNFRIYNEDTFAYTLLDDIWLGIRSPNG
jgi:hypothetical protein